MQQQQAINSGMVLQPESFFNELGDTIDATPAIVAGIILGAAATLFLLKKAGFRFNFGVGARVG